MKHPERFIGIDIASETFAVALYTTPGQPLPTKSDIVNTVEGFDELLRWFGEQQVTSENSIICLEATGVYAEELCYYLSSKQYQVAVEPPMKVKRAFQQSAHKNDTVDAKQIAEYAHRYSDTLNIWVPPGEILEQLRVLLTTREQLVNQRTASKNALLALRRKPVQTPVANQAYEQTIKQLTDTIIAIEHEMKRLLSNDQNFRNHLLILTSIPGIGFLLASNLLVQTRGFTTSLQYKRLASYAGIAPLQHESGKSVYRTPRSRRFGPARLRKLLYLASCSVATHHPEFRKYYLRKKAEGKPARLILNNIANKLLKLIFTLVQSQQPFIPNYRSVNPVLLKLT